MNQRKLVDGEIACEQTATAFAAAHLGQALPRILRQLGWNVLLVEWDILRAAVSRLTVVGLHRTPPLVACLHCTPAMVYV
jgi:hypothetical protein